MPAPPIGGDSAQIAAQLCVQVKRPGIDRLAQGHRRHPRILTGTVEADRHTAGMVPAHQGAAYGQIDPVPFALLVAQPALAQPGTHLRMTIADLDITPGGWNFEPLGQRDGVYRYQQGEDQEGEAAQYSEHRCSVVAVWAKRLWSHGLRTTWGTTDLAGAGLVLCCGPIGVGFGVHRGLVWMCAGALRPALSTPRST